MRLSQRTASRQGTCRSISRSSVSPALRPGRPTRLAPVRAGFELATASPEVVAGGGALLAAALGSLAWLVSGGAKGPQMEATKVEQQDAPLAAERENAVLVFGATGRLGRIIVQQLLDSGRQVVAAVRSTDKAAAVFGDLVSTPGSGLFVEEVDVTNRETLTAAVFKGVSQVVVALGPVFGRLPDGGMGFLDDMTSDRVEAQGTANIAEAVAEHLPKQQASTTTILPMVTEDDLGAWERLDDVIMGGQSSSVLAPSQDGTGATWRGDLIVEGGGFCGARTKKLALDLSGYDGLLLRVKGDGQTFKLNIKTIDQEDVPESTYQATFDTDPSGGWVDAYIPWHNFVPVTRAQSDPEGPPLDASSISKFGLVLSRFEFNKMPNPDYKAGPFELQLQGGFQAYRQPRSQLVMVSSAGVERNAIIGDDAEKRKKDIPIVRLNPGGTLNHKYAAEVALRSTGYPYTIVRSTGMSDSIEAGNYLLEADQGDTISGNMTRPEVAAVVAAALEQPEAVGKTFEVRRNAALDAKDVVMGEPQFRRMFLKLALDKHRWRVGLRPFPRVVPPPPPPAPEERAAVLSDNRVVVAGAADTEARNADNDKIKAVVEQKKEKVAVKG